jgi:hypothetical protein
MVALGMLPKEEDFRQLKSSLEALEIKNSYMTEVITWLARRQGRTFVPPAGKQARPESLAVTERRGDP